jgi:PAS domain S-box-containing protein
VKGESAVTQTPVQPQAQIARSGGCAPSVLWTAFEHAPVGVGVCDQDGVFVLVNDFLARLLRRRRADVTGRPFLSFIHPDERTTSLACYFRALVAAAATGHTIEPGDTELRCLAGDGSPIWVKARWSMTAPGPDRHQYAIVHLSDLTGRKRLEAELAETQQRP